MKKFLVLVLAGLVLAGECRARLGGTRWYGGKSRTTKLYEAAHAADASEEAKTAYVDYIAKKQEAHSGKRSGKYSHYFHLQTNWDERERVFAKAKSFLDEAENRLKDAKQRGDQELNDLDEPGEQHRQLVAIYQEISNLPMSMSYQSNAVFRSRHVATPQTIDLGRAGEEGLKTRVAALAAQVAENNNARATALIAKAEQAHRDEEHSKAGNLYEQAAALTGLYDRVPSSAKAELLRKAADSYGSAYAQTKNGKDLVSQASALRRVQSTPEELAQVHEQLADMLAAKGDYSNAAHAAMVAIKSSTERSRNEDLKRKLTEFSIKAAQGKGDAQTKELLLREASKSILNATGTLPVALAKAHEQQLASLPNGPDKAYALIQTARELRPIEHDGSHGKIAGLLEEGADMLPYYDDKARIEALSDAASHRETEASQRGDHTVAKRAQGLWSAVAAQARQGMGPRAGLRSLLVPAAQAYGLSHQQYAAYLRFAYEGIDRTRDQVTALMERALSNRQSVLSGVGQRSAAK